METKQQQQQESSAYRLFPQLLLGLRHNVLPTKPARHLRVPSSHFRRHRRQRLALKAAAVNQMLWVSMLSL